MSAGFTAAGFGRGKLSEAGLDEDVMQEHRERIHGHQRRGTFPGFGECVVHDGKVVYLDLCGFSNKEHTVRLTEHTLYRGYSMMKPITATAFMTLVEEGLVHWDQPVWRYLPKFRNLQVMKKKGSGVEPLKQHVTLRHLMLHTSGLGYGAARADLSLPMGAARTPAEKLYKDVVRRQDSGEVDTLEKLCDALCELPLLFQPGARYEYGMGVDVLGRVVEVIARKPLRQVIQERVLVPAGMRDAAWDVPASRARKVCGYYRILRKPGSSERYLERLDGAKPADSRSVRGSPSHYGGRLGNPAAGGIWGSCFCSLHFSMLDVALFCQMLLNNGVSASGRRVLREPTVRLLGRNWLKEKRSADTPFPPGWGSEDVGWSPLGNVQLTGPHAGAMFMGGMSYYWMDPKRKFFAAMMTETYWQANPLGWKDDTDTMEKVLERAVEAAAALRKRPASARGARGSPPKKRRTRQ